MLKENVKVNGNRFSKEVEYVEPIRTGRTARKKEEIVSKYSETHQLNVMRKAILGDTNALSELKKLEDFLNDTA